MAVGKSCAGYWDTDARHREVRMMCAMLISYSLAQTLHEVFFAKEDAWDVII